MAITSVLGTSDSLLGNIQLGGGPVSTIKVANISETITFSESLPINKTLILAIAETLTLTITLAKITRKPRAAADTLVFTETIVRVLPKTVTTVTPLHITFFESCVNVSIRVRNCSDTLVLAEVGSVRLPETFTPVILDTLTLVETNFRNFTKQMAATGTLVLVEAFVAGGTHIQNIDENLVFDERGSGLIAKFGPIAESLTFTETLSALHVHLPQVHETLVFSEADSTQAGSIYTRDISESIGLREGYQFPTRIGNQFVWINGAEAIKVPDKCYVILECTETSTIITLPCPQVADSEKNLHQQVIVRSMTNKMYTYIRRNNLKQLGYTFLLGRKVTQNLQAFCNINIDKVITLSNWKGEIWKVYITNNPLEYTGKSLFENEGERWDVPFEFQGVKILG